MAFMSRTCHAESVAINRLSAAEMLSAQPNSIVRRAVDMSKRPDDNGVSGLPESWGRIVIPDDISELDDVAEEVRAQLRSESRHARLDRRLPYLILVAIVTATLLSLFLVPWLAGAGNTEPSPSGSPSSVSQTSTSEPQDSNPSGQTQTEAYSAIHGCEQGCVAPTALLP